MHIIIFFIFNQQQSAGADRILFPALRQYLFVSGNVMSSYVYIILSLILYPILGYFFIRLTKTRPQLQNIIASTLIALSLLTILGLLTHTITISENLNWFVVTANYMTLSVLLWRAYFTDNRIFKTISKVLLGSVFGLGYLVSTFGAFFVILAANDLDTDQRIWLTNNLIYKERNIGQGPDPSLRLKEVEIFKRVNWFPLIATRLEIKSYDEWNFPLKRNLNVSYSNEREILYLSSVVYGYKTFAWNDTISLKQKHYR